MLICRQPHARSSLTGKINTVQYCSLYCSCCWSLLFLVAPKSRCPWWLLRVRWMRLASLFIAAHVISCSQFVSHRVSLTSLSHSSKVMTCVDLTGAVEDVEEEPHGWRNTYRRHGTSYHSFTADEVCIWSDRMCIHSTESAKDKPNRKAAMRRRNLDRVVSITWDLTALVICP